MLSLVSKQIDKQNHSLEASSISQGDIEKARHPGILTFEKHPSLQQRKPSWSEQEIFTGLRFSQFWRFCESLAILTALVL